MDKKLGLVLGLVFPLALAANAQSGSTLMGARGAGMGYGTAALSNEWSIFNNIGGLYNTKSITAIFAHEVNPNLVGANRIAAGVAGPLKKGAMGFGVFRFGDQLYSEQIISAGFSNRFGLAALGAKVNYVQYHAEGFGTQSAIGIDFGGIATLSSQFSIGAYITNLNQPKLSSQDDEHLPTKLTVGFKFSPNEKVIAVSEVEKDINHQPIIRVGIEFNVYKRIQFRSGLNLNPSDFHLGVGYKGDRLIIDYALQFNPDLRVGHQASIGYVVRSTK